jgi:hypothetical protein
VALKARPVWTTWFLPPLAQTKLLGRGAGPLSFRSGRMACRDALSAVIRRLLRKGCPRLLPLYTATAVRCVVSSAATGLWLYLKGRAPNGVVGAPTSDAPLCVCAFALRVAEALAALTLQWSLWMHVRIHRHSKAADFGEEWHKTTNQTTNQPTNQPKV